MATNTNSVLATLARFFKSMPADQLADMEDLVKADSTDEPRPYKGVAASGNGAERTTEQSSPDADHGSSMMKLYASLAQLMMQQNERQEATEKALRKLGKIVGMMAGVSKADGEDEADSDEGTEANVTIPSWDASGAKPKTGEDDELERAEKAALAGNPQKKSIGAIFDDLHNRVSGTSRNTGRTGLAVPPDLTGFTKSNVYTGPSDSEIEQMSQQDALHALTMRQRRAFEAATGQKITGYKNG